uniref:Uncharacterized protein n=1 Tax=Branchiostoma floridae TaxID=7739 RepID=C3XXU8_BRAFL|eukprot:XP_002611548.1 hypothetical protein BRAFLDRAFT_63813 [Branchiostoma floridae]
MDDYRIDFVSLNESVKKMRLRTRLLEERGVKLPKAPSQRPAAVAAPVPLSVSEGDVVARQGPLSQPGAKDTSSSTPVLVDTQNAPSQVPNKWTSAPTVRAKTSQLPSKMAEGLQKHELLEMTVELLCSAAIKGACRELHNEMISSKDQNVSKIRYPEELEHTSQQEGVEEKDEELEMSVGFLCSTAIGGGCRQLLGDIIPSGDHELQNADRNLDELEPVIQEKEVEEKKDNDLEMTVELLCSAAMRGACRQLLGDLIPSGDHELKNTDRALEELEPALQQKEVEDKKEEELERAEKTEDDLHLMKEPEQNSPKEIPSGDHELENTDLDKLQPALQQRAVEKIEKIEGDPELERAVQLLSSTAILDAYTDLYEKMALSPDTELEEDNLEKQERSGLQQEKADPALHQERDECSLQEEKTEDGLHLQEPELNSPKDILQNKSTAKKTWKARGKRVMRRLGRAFRVLTSCCRPSVAP